MPFPRSREAAEERFAGAEPFPGNNEPVNLTAAGQERGEDRNSQILSALGPGATSKANHMPIRREQCLSQKLKQLN
jgi:hypothetical protein